MNRDIGFIKRLDSINGLSQVFFSSRTYQVSKNKEQKRKPEYGRLLLIRSHPEIQISGWKLIHKGKD